MNKLFKIFAIFCVLCILLGSFYSCTSATSLVITADSLNMSNPNIILKDSVSFTPKR